MGIRKHQPRTAIISEAAKRLVDKRGTDEKIMLSDDGGMRMLGWALLALALITIGFFVYCIREFMK